MTVSRVLDAADTLLQLDPIRTYPKRAGDEVMKLVEASGFRIQFRGNVIAETPSSGEPALTLPLRSGRNVVGSLDVFSDEKLDDEDVRLARWGARILGRGLTYRERLSTEGGRRGNEHLDEALKRTPLTPRECDVVRRLVGGSSTREIAKGTGLTVSTVNTYLKRIFSKLGVHSRVELVARMAGTAQ